jgi:ribonuclease P protein component
VSLRGSMPLRHNKDVPGVSPKPVLDSLAAAAADHRLRKHADFQRVYREGRKQFSPSMSYFYALRGAGSQTPAGPRVGLTAGKVLGKAVERNRIKRRMRDIVRRQVPIVSADVDIVLHPRRSVLTVEFAKLESEVVRIFSNVQSVIDKTKSRQTALNSEESQATP